MTSGRLVSLALGSIRRNAARSLLTVLGVVIGVGSVIVMIAIGQGAQREIEARIAGLGTNLVVVTPGANRASGGVSGGAGTLDSLSVDDAVAIGRDAFHVSHVTPVVATFTRAIAGNVNWRTSLLGVDASYQYIRSWSVSDGRFFDDEDVRGRRKVVLLGKTVADALFGQTDAVGQTVRLRGVPFEVAGVLTAKGQSADGSDQDDVILLPYTTLQTRLAGRQFVAQILASATSERDVALAMGEIRDILRDVHELPARAEDDFTLKDQAELAETAQGTTRVMTMLLAAVASVSLVVGGIGIMNIMLVSVTERTREIGIRRAVGARRSDVLAQFLVEAVVLSGLGGVLGALLGVIVAAVVGRATGWAVAVTPASLGLALAFSGGVGVFFGWYPARRAAALDPIDALRFQ